MPGRTEDALHLINGLDKCPGVLREECGRQFDPRVVGAFLGIVPDAMVHYGVFG